MNTKLFPQRISLMTLGVADVAASRAFYEGLGFKAAKEPTPDVAFFDMGGVIFGLFGVEALAEDAGVTIPEITDGSGAFHGASLAVNMTSEAEVDTALTFVEDHGGNITQPARKVFWGGYSGYFADPDGHLWEVAYNPFWTLDEAGRVVLPGAENAEGNTPGKSSS